LSFFVCCCGTSRQQAAAPRRAPIVFMPAVSMNQQQVQQSQNVVNVTLQQPARPAQPVHIDQFPRSKPVSSYEPPPGYPPNQQQQRLYSVNKP
jgi:hypothetical protein